MIFMFLIALQLNLNYLLKKSSRILTSVLMQPLGSFSAKTILFHINDCKFFIATSSQKSHLFNC